MLDAACWALQGFFSWFGEQELNSGLCHCVFKTGETVSYAARYASCLCIHLCFACLQINLSLQIRKSSTKLKDKMRGDDRGPASLSFTRWRARFLFSGFCHFAESARVGIRLEQHCSGFFGWPSRWLLKVTDVWSLTLHTLQSVCCFPLWSLMLSSSNN